MYRLISFVVSVCFRRSPRASLFPYTTLFRSSAVGADLAGEQTQQAGFAVPVASDDADPCALVDAQAHRLQHHTAGRSEEHTSELQSRGHLVCRLLLEKKKIHRNYTNNLLM